MASNNEMIGNWKSIPFTKVGINDDFWAPIIKKVKKTTLKTCIEKCEVTGRIDNFAKAAGLMKGGHKGIYYDDSDVYKVLEGAAYSLMMDPDSELEKKLDEIIYLISKAQEPDGYLFTYYTLEAPDQKWTDMDKHEMYCGGHLIEAAVAHYKATGKRNFLDVACRLADHFDNHFGPGKKHWVPGHEEIELALVKLYSVTGEERYWKLALWLLEERGHGYGKGGIWNREDWGPAYCQDDVPVREIESVKGHAVRAMYLYTAMADVARISKEQTYIEALNLVWDNVVNRNMYITGGIGPSKSNEGFTTDYQLPNESAYCETCAAIGMVLWNHRMNLLFGDAKYADVIEREIYNGVLSGLSFSGNQFFYVNPLASKGDHHRQEWYDCSCCPTNIVRILPSLGDYVYAQFSEGIAVNLYLSNESELTLKTGNHVRIEQKSQYPWDGNIAISVKPEKSELFSMKLRIPQWCRSYKVIVNGKTMSSSESLLHKGYITLNRQWANGDQINLELDMGIQVVRANSQVEEDQGKVAIQRGPIVYCVEEEDNKGLKYEEFKLPSNLQVGIKHEKELFNGVTLLTTSTSDGDSCVFLPYFAWDNRSPGFMQVWIDEESDNALYKY